MMYIPKWFVDTTQNKMCALECTHRRNRMPQAPKRKKLKRTEKTAVLTPILPHNELTLVESATIKCKQTREYVRAYNAMTLASAKQANRNIGTRKWYCSNKDTLVAILVLHQFAAKLQKFFRDIVMENDLGGDKWCSKTNICPISLTPMSEIPYGHRYRHLNTWFDRTFLAKHMSQTSDFSNPVTRVEFREEDILKIDPALMKQYGKRKELRATLTDNMAMVQNVENEMEEVFQTMVEAAEEIPSRREFRIVFDDLVEDFRECHDDLAGLDYDRSVLALKSLRDVIRGDPNRPTIMSRKRERQIRNFLALHGNSERHGEGARV